MTVTTASLDRTVQIWTPDNSDTGAGFTINRHAREWLITAAHLVRGFDPTEIKVVTREDKVYQGMEHVPTDLSVDVAVFSLFKKQLTPNMLLEPASSGIAMGQSVYLHGFPFGWNLANGDLRLPFTKTATVSGATLTDHGKLLWVFDGMGLEGFSGGPIVFKNVSTNQWQVMGIASMYQTIPILVHDVHGDAVGHARTNSGYFFGFDIGCATESIDAFVENTAA
jgi:hypothetical protein